MRVQNYFRSDSTIQGFKMMFRWFGLYGILLGLLACSTIPEGQGMKKSGHPSEPSALVYVGLKTPPMPPGHETELGYLLGLEGEGRYAIEVVNFRSKKIVWMGRLLFHDEKGRAHWKIIAAMPPQQLPAGYRFSGGNCLNDGKLQPEIVAIYKANKRKPLIQAHKAWKADPENEAFEPLDPERIQCNSERLNH